MRTLDLSPSGPRQRGVTAVLGVGASALEPGSFGGWSGRWRARLVAVALASTLGFSVSVAAGQAGDDEARAAARRMAEEAAELYDAREYDKARDLFRRAYAVYQAPTLPLWEARALVKLGRLVEAEARYAIVERYKLQPDDPDLFRAAVSEAGAEVDRLRKRIPTVTIMLTGTAPNDPAVEVRIDGRRVNPALLGFPKPVDPGTRTISVLVRGKERDRVVVDLAERDKKSIKLKVPEDSATRAEPEDSTPDSPGLLPSTQAPAPRDRPQPSEERGGTQRALGTASLGLGVVGIGTGVLAGLVAVNKHKSLEENCPDARCPPDYHDDLNAFRALRTVSTVGYVVGAVGLTTGVVLLLTAPDGSSDEEVGAVWLQLTPSSARLISAF